MHTLKLPPKHVKPNTKFHAFRVYMVDFGWCLCVCMCVPVCVCVCM